MEVHTALVLTVQLVALFSIAGALLLYLLCKVKGSRNVTLDPRCGSILITSADTALGLQLSTYLASKGCRVFAGMKDPVDSLPAKLLKGWMKARENALDMETDSVIGSIVPLKVDVTKEDILREATEKMGAHLNASERGILAVVNTAGSIFRGRMDSQEIHEWECMFKQNVLGCLRVARAFIGLLRPTRGRLIFLGSGSNGDGLLAYTASKNSVEATACALRDELKPYGVSVVTLDSSGVPAEALYKSPIPFTISDIEGIPTQYSAEVLTHSSLQVIERALFDPRPYDSYSLSVPQNKFYCNLPCRSEFVRSKNGSFVQKV